MIGAGRSLECVPRRCASSRAALRDSLARSLSTRLGVSLIAGLSVGGCASLSSREEAASAAPVEEVAQRADVAAPLLSFPDLAARLEEYERARLERILACVTGPSCAPAPALAVDDATAASFFAASGELVSLRTRALLARAIIDRALVQGADDRSARRRGLTFREGSSVFAWDDLRAVWAEAPASRRADWLRAAEPTWRAVEAIAATERALVEGTAARVGMTRGALLSLRVGLDERSLRALLDTTVQATGMERRSGALEEFDERLSLFPRTGPVIPWGRPPLELGPSAADPLLLDALATAVSLPRPRTPSEARALAGAFVLEARRLALGVRALLDGIDGAARDELASRVANDAAPAVAGAGALLPVDEAGVVIERFIACLRTPAVALALWDGKSIDAIVTSWHEAPPVDEQGFPEAFVSLLRTLRAR